MAGTMVHCGRILMVKLSQFILGLRQFTISVEDCESKVHKTIRCFGIAFKAIVDEEGAIRYARDQAGVAASFPPSLPLSDSYCIEMGAAPHCRNIRDRIHPSSAGFHITTLIYFVSLLLLRI